MVGLPPSRSRPQLERKRTIRLSSTSYQCLLLLVMGISGYILIGYYYYFILNLNLDWIVNNDNNNNSNNRVASLPNPNNDQIKQQQQHYGPLHKTSAITSNANDDTTHDSGLDQNSKLLIHETKFPCIHKESPPAIEIQQILRKERQGIKIVNPNNEKDDTDYDYFKDMSLIYELTYAFVAAFQAGGIPIFLAFGSHIGARRHHGIIPFGEKDVDFAIFSRDRDRIKDVIRKVLVEKSMDVTSIKDANFGYHVTTTFSHYFDFWLFEHREEKKENPNVIATSVVQCMGWDHEECTGCESRNVSPGCSDWYRRYRGEKMAPIFAMEDWFPPRYEMFGTHKVPIPNASNDLAVHYRGGLWDEYCGDHRKGRPDSERLCSKRYGDYPFVFLRPESGIEELRQGGVVLHESPIAAPIDSTPVYSKNHRLEM